MAQKQTLEIGDANAQYQKVTVGSVNLLDMEKRIARLESIKNGNGKHAKSGGAKKKK